MKTIGTIFLLLTLPFFAPAQTSLDKMITASDLIFKGQVLSSTQITNTVLELSSMHPFATKFKIISVLKGNISTNIIVFEHYTTGPGFWSGPTPPESHQFEVGQPYLIFAKDLDQPDRFFSPLSDATNHPNEFRQFYSDGVIHTLDIRPLNNFSGKDALWFELQLLLNDSNPTNGLYAIDKLDQMSLAGRHDDEWSRKDYFNRKAVFECIVASNHQQR